MSAHRYSLSIVANGRPLLNLHREPSLQCGVVDDGLECELSLKRTHLAEP